MESNSIAANMEFPSFDEFNDFDLMDNSNNIMLHNETSANFSKVISPNDPTFTEASMMPKTPVDVEGKLPSPLTTNDQTQLDQMNPDPDMFAYDQVVDQLVPSPGLTNESFLHDSNSNHNFGQSMYSANGSSVGHDDVFSPLIMERTNSFPMALAEKLPQEGGYSAQPFNSEHGANSVQATQVNGHIGNSSSLQAEFQGSQRVESTNQGNRIMFADQFQQNNGNNNSNVNQQSLPYPNIYPQNSSGTEYLNGGSTQMNLQGPPNWVSYRQNNIHRPFSPSGSQQANRFQATGNSDPQNYNLMLPRLSAPLRPQQLNNPLQMLDQISNMPNASNSFLQNSILNKHTMPQLMPQNLSYQQDQVSMTPGTYNQQNYNTRLAESSTPLRTPMLPPPPRNQTNQLGVSNLQYRNSMQPRANNTLPSGGFMFQGLNNQRQNQFNQFNPMTNQFGTQSSNSMLHESLMNSGNQYQLPPQQANNQFSMMHGLPNLDLHNSRLPETSFLPRLQQQQQQQAGLFNQTARPIPTYPASGTALSSIVLNSLHQRENGGTSAPQRGRRRRGPARSRFELGESSSSSFKRFRRGSTLPQASSAEQENRSFLPLPPIEATTSSNSTGLAHPRQIKNSVYDPLFEGIGLPIDPHLRLFATANMNEISGLVSKGMNVNF